MKLVTFTLISLVGPTLSVTSGQSSAATHAAALDENRGAANFTFLEETGFPSPPAIIQSVRRLVRHLGRSMGVMATKSRRATGGCKEKCDYAVNDVNCMYACMKDNKRQCSKTCLRPDEKEKDVCVQNCKDIYNEEEKAQKADEEFLKKGIDKKQYLGVNVPGDMDCEYVDKWEQSQTTTTAEACAAVCPPKCRFLAACLDIHTYANKEKGKGYHENTFGSVYQVPAIYEKGKEPSPVDMFQCGQDPTGTGHQCEDGNKLCKVGGPSTQRDIVESGAECGLAYVHGRKMGKITVRVTYKCTKGNQCMQNTCHIVNLNYTKGKTSIHGSA